MDPSLLFLGALGAGLGLFVPVSMWRHAAKVERQTKRTRGEVIGVVAHSSPSQDMPSTTYHARVRFAHGSREFEFVSEVGVSWRKPVIGAKVEVRFDPSSPDSAEVERGQSPELARWCAIALAVLGNVLLAGVIWVA